MVIKFLRSNDWHVAVGTKDTPQSNTQKQGISSWNHIIYDWNKPNWNLEPSNPRTLEPSNPQTASTRVFDSSRKYTALCSTSVLMAGRLVIARSAYCRLCLIVPECYCFICPNRRLFSITGKVFQKQEAAFLWRSLTWFCFYTTWLFVKLLYLWCKVLYHGEVS